MRYSTVWSGLTRSCGTLASVRRAACRVLLLKQSPSVSLFLQGWFAGCDVGVRAVAGRANPYLFEQLLQATKYCDVACVKMLREGADIVGLLVRSGIGTPIEASDAKCPNALRKDMAAWNEVLVKELREDALSDKLMELTKEDAQKCRMTPPQQINEDSLSSCLMCPRFAVEQAKPDGRIKVRAVDNFSWAAFHAGGKSAQKPNSINGSFAQPCVVYFCIFVRITVEATLQLRKSSATRFLIR